MGKSAKVEQSESGDYHVTDIEKRLTKYSYDLWYSLREIGSVAWAADQLLNHNSDTTISALELNSRVDHLICIIQKEAFRVADEIDPAFAAILGKKVI